MRTVGARLRPFVFCAPKVASPRGAVEARASTIASRGDPSPVAILVLLTGLNLVNYIDRFLVMAVSENFGAEFGLSDSGRGAS